MKLAIHFRLLAALAFFLPHAFAASLDLVVSPSTTSPTIGGQVDFTMTVENSADVTISPAQLRAEFPSAFTVLRVSSNIPTNSLNPNLNPITVLSNSVTFQIDTFTPGQQYVLGMRLRPNQGGTFTNSFVLSGQSFTTPTNIVLTVSNGQADLSIQVSPLPAYALAFDLLAYQITATNRGPSTVSGVLVTNIIPSNSQLISHNGGTRLTRPGANQLNWSVGTLTNNTAQRLTLTIQPLTNGTFPLSASIFAPDVIDSGTNNLVTNSIIIQPIVTNTVQLTRGTRFFNRDTALIEETVTVQNISTNAIPGARILVEGFTTGHRLFNVAGTNGILPYVAVTNALTAGQSIPVRMQYFFNDRTYRPLNLIGVQAPGVATNTQVGLTATNITVTNNTLTFTFPTAPGRTYTIESSDTVPFPPTPTVVASTNASASTVTLSDPLRTNTPQRFFRAVETR